MGWNLAKKYVAKRDVEVWAILEGKLIRPPGRRLSWLHTVEEVPFASGQWSRARGFLYLAENAFYFTAEGDPGITFMPFVRVGRINWDDAHDGFAVTFADPYERGIWRQHWYRVLLPGQSGHSAEIIIRDFADKMRAAYELNPHPEEAELWPADGSLGPGVFVPDRR